MVSTHPVPKLRDLVFPRKLDIAKSVLSNPNLELTYSARFALFAACREIAERGRLEILLPAFHCPSGITPAIEAGLQPVFYRIRPDLTIDYEDLLSKATKQTGAVLVIHFFGVATNLHPLSPLRINDVSLIEDWSHSFLEGDPVHLSGNDSDYHIYSFWKLVPSGVGGGLLRGANSKRSRAAHRPAPPVKKQIVLFKRLLEESLDHSPYRTARMAFQLMEKARLALKKRNEPAQSQQVSDDVPGETYYEFDHALADCGMSRLARRLIEASDLDDIATKRRNNYRQYGQLLQNSGPLSLPFPELPSQSCPWVFPVMLEGRNSVDHLWRCQGVALHTFGIYLHSSMFKTADEKTIRDAQHIAERLLCLSIHQDIEPSRIDHSVQIIRNHLAGRG